MSFHGLKTNSKGSDPALSVKVTVCYIGSSLLARLRKAESDINREHRLDLSIAAHNFGSTHNQDERTAIEQDLSASDMVFVIHVMDGENAARLLLALDKSRASQCAIIVINCMPD